MLERISDVLRPRGLRTVLAAALITMASYAAAVELRADHPEARAISAGMSGDFEQAVAAGATHVRIGRSILGERPPLR